MQYPRLTSCFGFGNFFFLRQRGKSIRIYLQKLKYKTKRREQVPNTNKKTSHKKFYTMRNTKHKYININIFSLSKTSLFVSSLFFLEGDYLVAVLGDISNLYSFFFFFVFTGRRNEQSFDHKFFSLFSFFPPLLCEGERINL